MEHTIRLHPLLACIRRLFGLGETDLQYINGPQTLPAPLSDINGAIALGCLSYAFILVGGITANKGRGLLLTLKEFLLDYASPETRALGIKMIEQELLNIPNPKARETAQKYLAEIAQGNRDFRF